MTSTCTATALASAAAKRVLTQKAVEQHAAKSAAEVAAASHHGTAQMSVAAPPAGMSGRVHCAILSLHPGGT